jgi:hypothetical protein
VVVVVGGGAVVVVGAAAVVVSVAPTTSAWVLGAGDLLTVTVFTVGVPLTVTVEAITVTGKPSPSMGTPSDHSCPLVGSGCPPRSIVRAGAWPSEVDTSSTPTTTPMTAAMAALADTADRNDKRTG